MIKLLGITVYKLIGAYEALKRNLTMITPTIAELIRLLLDTNSPKNRLTLFLEFALEHPEEVSQETAKELITFLKGKQAAKTNEGKENIKHRAFEKKTKGDKNYRKPKFFSDNRSSFTCKTCGHQSSSCNVFKLKQDGRYREWCATPNCFPSEFRDSMESDKEYQKWINGIQ